MASPVSEEFLSFFSYGNKSTVSISASSAVVSFLENYQLEKNSRYNDFYVPVNVNIRFNGKDYYFEDCGLRLKGNMSREHFFKDMNPHMKLSFKATFDDTLYSTDSVMAQFRKDWTGKEKERSLRKDRNFLGLEKLDLKCTPRNSGKSTLRDIYAYELMRSDGLFTPYANLGEVNFSSPSRNFSGNYEFVETIDKEFLKRRLQKDDAKGDLYKCVYNDKGPADLTRSGAVNTSTGVRVANGKIGCEDVYNYYRPVYQLKTNDKLGDGSDFSKMANLIWNLRECIYGSGTRETLDSIVDVDQFLHFAADTFLLGNFDDQRYNANNYYIYFRPSDNKAIFIPYDWDWCLGIDQGQNMAERKPLDTATSGYTGANNIYTAVLFNSHFSVADLQDRYMAYVAAAKDTFLNTSAYKTFARAFAMENSSETDSVVSYMNTKKNYCGR